MDDPCDTVQDGADLVERPRDGRIPDHRREQSSADGRIGLAVLDTGRRVSPCRDAFARVVRLPTPDVEPQRPLRLQALRQVGSPEPCRGQAVADAADVGREPLLPAKPGLLEDQLVVVGQVGPELDQRRVFEELPDDVLDSTKSITSPHVDTVLVDEQQGDRATAGPVLVDEGGPLVLGDVALGVQVRGRELDHLAVDGQRLPARRLGVHRPRRGANGEPPRQVFGTAHDLAQWLGPQHASREEPTRLAQVADDDLVQRRCLVHSGRVVGRHQLDQPMLVGIFLFGGRQQRPALEGAVRIVVPTEPQRVTLSVADRPDLARQRRVRFAAQRDDVVVGLELVKQTSTAACCG